MGLTFNVPVPPAHPRSVRSGADRPLLLRINGIFYPPREGFVVRVFLGDAKASASTPTTGNPSYVGEAPILANEYLPDEERASDLPWARKTTSPPRRDFDPPVTLEWEVGHEIQRLHTPVAVTLVLLDPRGEELPSDSLRLDSVEIVDAG